MISNNSKFGLTAWVVFLVLAGSLVNYLVLNKALRRGLDDPAKDTQTRVLLQRIEDQVRNLRNDIVGKQQQPQTTALLAKLLDHFKTDDSRTKKAGDVTGADKKDDGTFVLGGKHKSIPEKDLMVKHPKLFVSQVPPSKIGRRGNKGKVAICTVLCVHTIFTNSPKQSSNYEWLDMTIMQYANIGAVLAEQIRRLDSDYQIDPLVIIPPELKRFAPLMEQFGWIVREETNPAKRSLIRRKEYLKHVDKGSCGFDEWTRLVPMGYVEYDRVIIIDMDAMLPSGTMDEVFDSPSVAIHSHGYWAVPWPAGFSSIKPSKEHLPRILDLVYAGLWNVGEGGWNNTGIGHHYGGSGVQGMLPYYFLHVTKNRWTKEESPLELDKCRWNQQLQSPEQYPECSGFKWPHDIRIFQWTVCGKPIAQCGNNMWEQACYPALRLFLETWIAVQRDYLKVPNKRIQKTFCPATYINIDNSNSYLGGKLPKWDNEAMSLSRWE